MATPDRPRLPRPVKKRKRHPQPCPTLPDGFVRDELDEDDSADDPDFEADDLDPAEDEDDEPYDAFEERDLGIIGVRTRNSDADAQLRQIWDSATLDPATSPFTNLFRKGEDAEFEVDDLDSTDEEEGKDGDEGQSMDTTDIGRRMDVASMDDETREGDDDVEDEEGEEDGDEERDEEYQQFLQSLLTEDIEVSSAPQGNPLDDDVGSRVEPPSWAIDDDDDFDYLRESARVHDDPLEYRDDYHVSKKELVQLLSHSKGKYLRRPPRSSKPKTDAVGRGSAVAPPISIPLNVLQPALRSGTANAVPLGLPGVLQQSVGVGAVQAAPVMLPAASSSGALSTAQVANEVAAPPYIAPPQMAYLNVSPAVTYQFRDQLAVHVQILTALYANVKSNLRKYESRGEGNEQGENAEGLAAVREVATRAENLIKGLIDNRRVSTLYYRVINTNMARLKLFSEKIVNKVGISGFSYESSKSSIYNLPVLDLLESFLGNCSSLPLSGLPASALQPFQPFNRSDITEALLAKRVRRQYSGSNSQPGWYVWTAADDTLLAMMIAKYGSDTADFSKDLLPHRQNDDCLTRVRYLSSRRCPDNPVKRQVMVISAPLSKDELQLVSRGLALYQGNIDDPAVWKRIQRELLPGREWSHLQKLWGWRETRRKYKAKYRAKAMQKRKNVQDGAT